MGYQDLKKRYGDLIHLVLYRIRTGVRSRQIQKETGLSGKEIRAICRATKTFFHLPKAPPRPKPKRRFGRSTRRITVAMVNEILRLYTAGETLVDIGKRVGTGETFIRKVLALNNVPMRPRRRAAQ